MGTKDARKKGTETKGERLFSAEGRDSGFAERRPEGGGSPTTWPSKQPTHRCNSPPS